MNLLNALKGMDGGFEVQRTLGAIGTLVFILVVPAFILLGIIKDVTVSEFCTAFPFGLGSCILATSGSIAIKDRNVAAAKLTSAQADATKAGQ